VVEAGIEKVRAMDGTRALLVARGGELIAERYFDGDDGPVNIKSASKTLISALVGIAIAEGHITSVDQPISELVPATFQDFEETTQQITVHHLLSMTTGLGSTSREHYGAWVAHRNWVRAALERPVVAAPGERFIYSTGNTHLLSAILTEVTGQSTHAYARQVLLDPLGIEVTSWPESPRGIDFGGNNVAMTPRDMLTFGQLYLQDGRWNERQLVPADWVERSSRHHAEGWPDRYGAYGYLWWLPPGRPASAFMAVGFGGQFIIVAPETETVVVVTSTLSRKGAAWDRQLLDTLDRHLLTVSP
jgi:CubicO group peptidase (beta-lactamase class C family)